MNTMERYSAAIKRIGGTAGLLRLPEEVKKILQTYVDLETKVKMLEMVADALENGK